MRLAACVLVFALAVCSAQSPADAVKTETDPGRRAEKALTLAEAEFDSARAAYAKNEIHAGDGHLDAMTQLLNEVVSALAQTRKSRSYKRAEMRVSHLQRRLNDLLDGIDIEQRGWAEQTARRLSEIHDKLLQGAMKK